MSSTNKTNYSYTKKEIDAMGGGSSLSDAISQKADRSDLSNYLPLSGGAMTSGLINRATNDSTITLWSGDGFNDGASLQIAGKDYASSRGDGYGAFQLVANNGTSAVKLLGKTTGELTWDGKQVAVAGDYLPRVDTGYKTISGNGQYLWCKFAVITIKYGYVNCPICFEVSGRGISKSNLQVLFQNTDSSDPGLNLFTSDNDTNFYIKKVATSTWELYYSYNGSWGSLTVYRVVNGVNGSIAINTTLENLSSEPTDKTQCVSSYFPKSGGQLSGNIVNRNTDADYLEIQGGTSFGKGASITLYGKDSSQKGSFYISAGNGSTNTYNLGGTPDGSLTWGGKSIDVIEEQGNGYIRYSNGLQICFGVARAGQDNAFPKAFKSGSIPDINIIHYTTDSSVYIATVQTGTGGNTTNTALNFSLWSILEASYKNYTAHYTAIGYWK